MATVDTQPNNTECHTGVHTEHLCYIIAQGFRLSDEEDFRALVNNPEYTCRHCGRTAKNGENLCVPDPL
jgi:hypothetical protein